MLSEICGVEAVAEEWKLLMQVRLSLQVLYTWRMERWICDNNRHQHDVQNFDTTKEEVTFSSHPDAFKFSTKFLDTSVSASARAWKYDSAFTDDDMFQFSSFPIHLGFAKLSFPSELSSGTCFHLLQKQKKQKVCLLTWLHLITSLLQKGNPLYYILMAEQVVMWDR